MKRLILALALAATAAPALAATTTAATRTYVHSCGYFSSKDADVAINYQNADLPWGTVVELIYATEGADSIMDGARRLDWQNESRIILTPTSGYTWTGEVTVETHYRSNARFYDGLQFVYRIIYPDDTVAYDNGGDSAWGHYKVALAWIGPCVGGGVERPAYNDVAVQTIER